MKQAAHDKMNLANQSYDKCVYAEAKQLYEEALDMFLQVPSSSAPCCC